MKKKLFVGLVSTALLLGFALTSAFAVEAPGDMVLKAPEGAKVTKKPVDFSHAKHKALDCTACHHKWDGKAEIQPCTDSGCHDNVDPSPKARREVNHFYNAFHNRKNEASCVGCHSALKKAKKPTGPTGCTQCHPK